MACGHCTIGVICRVLRLGSCEFSSVEEDELAIFLLQMPVSLPGGKVGVYASFRTISFSFKAVRSEYLSRTQRLRKGRPFSPFCTRHKLAPWPKTTYDIYIYIYIYIYIDTLAVLHVNVGLAQARPNYYTEPLLRNPKMVAGRIVVSAIETPLESQVKQSRSLCLYLLSVSGNRVPVYVLSLPLLLPLLHDSVC